MIQVKSEVEILFTSASLSGETSTFQSFHHEDEPAADPVNHCTPACDWQLQGAGIRKNTASWSSFLFYFIQLVIFLFFIIIIYWFISGPLLVFCISLYFS